MRIEMYSKIENHMISCMNDGVHDRCSFQNRGIIMYFL